MVALTAYDTETTWLVTPDQVAAAAFGLRTYGGVVGEIRLGEGAWQTTAFADPEPQTSRPNLIYPLPAAETEAAACRTLLRWWALRDSDRWQGRTRPNCPPTSWPYSPPDHPAPSHATQALRPTPNRRARSRLPRGRAFPFA